VFAALRYGIVARVQTVLSPGALRLPGVTQDPMAGALPVRGRHRAAPAGRPVQCPRQPEARPPGLFTRYALQHVALFPGRTVSILQAGCTTAGAELDLAALGASHPDLDICLIDEDSAATSAAVAAWPELASATLGELRLIPLRPRSIDIVHCPLLLHRISHAEVVLGRLTAALRPGGLLLLRITDPGSAAGFLDRRMPAALRAMTWRASDAGTPALHPAIYEPVATAAGLEAFISRHGLSIAHRARRPAGIPARPAVRLVGWVSGGRLASDHDELCYIVRKPEDRFARVLH
jgi:SAM-dependent methyltransferase